MSDSSLDIKIIQNRLSLIFKGELTLLNIADYSKQVDVISLNQQQSVYIDFRELNFLDSAGAVFIRSFMKKLSSRSIAVETLCQNRDILAMLELVSSQENSSITTNKNKITLLEKIGKVTLNNYYGFISFMHFIGELFVNKFHYLLTPKNIRYKEIAFEINESGVKAFWIVSLTSFLIGLVLAYQSAYQLKIYGANIFIVDMLGLSILRELAPVITAIVVAGRSGSAFTAQIGAMKITQELDAMRTMGFNPYRFLVVPRILALMISLPILIFVADMMALLGGMIIANIDLGISTDLFLDRFSSVIAVKHFFIGIIKGPFFAFLIASIGIYRGLMVKDDTQSLGFNTTKSVVEAIFAVIVCDAIFSIAFTSLKI
ncbi:MlaE family lipid ABC transporter permease subunit [Sulfurimonas sp.]|uniref:ABC transporter permease n=1 Tax=Sulfurimonas sp. TaxID=2022749 RepID=UPI0025E42E6A|nr:MlaE family lipid ABC transporter permease subunit [Sulfurimonas sp.]MDD5158244.1 MlaE family lipid ABC transporter permease subunit [Sulfurimonas sp.]